jgi:hypothetical protein
MKNILKNIRNTLLTIFGDIKIFRFPFFILYNPGSYLIKGPEMRQIMNLVQDGDILIRGYRAYVDGYFIPGFFSHAGLYLGKVTKEDILKHKPDVKPSSIVEGEQMVIHAMANGVFLEDVLNFSRCDFMIILRRNPSIESPDSLAYTSQDVYAKALSLLDTPYDFGFNFSDISALSCTEFVNKCYKAILPDYHVLIKTRQVLFLRKKMIVPDDFISKNFQLIWKSNRVSEKRIQRILTRNTPSQIPG